MQAAVDDLCWGFVQAGLILPASAANLHPVATPPPSASRATPSESWTCEAAAEPGKLNAAAIANVTASDAGQYWTWMAAAGPGKDDPFRGDWRFKEAAWRDEFE